MWYLAWGEHAWLWGLSFITQDKEVATVPYGRLMVPVIHKAYNRPNMTLILGRDQITDSGTRVRTK